MNEQKYEQKDEVVNFEYSTLVCALLGCSAVESTRVIQKSTTRL